MNNTEEPSTFLIIALFVVVFPLFWGFVIWLISQLSGWQRLAQRFRSLLPPSGRKWRWQYGMVGWTGYNGVLILTTNSEGLFMETLLPFGFGHPRLFIPWHEFHDIKVVNYFFRRQVRAKIGFPHLATVHLPAAVFEQSEGSKVLEKAIQ